MYLVIKLDKQTIDNKFDSYWVLNTSALVIN